MVHRNHSKTCGPIKSNNVESVLLKDFLFIFVDFDDANRRVEGENIVFSLCHSSSSFSVLDY